MPLFTDWPLLSRALANHDASTAYTLLAERFPPPVAGRALIELIKTVPDWPRPEEMTNAAYDQRLSARELQVLRCAAQGMRVMETAKELILAVETIKTYRVHILVKLGAKNMTEAIHLGRELGLIR